MYRSDSSNYLAMVEPDTDAHDLRSHLAALDKVYQHVRVVVLAKQHDKTGLFPASTAKTEHGDYTDAWIRDNVYSVLCVWALALAYRKVEEDDGRAYELELAVIKLMRGILSAYMRQAHKVEAFKQSHEPIDALHAKYDTSTGNPIVGDDAWGHLQLDATSLFILFTAQMTASGMRIARTQEEVKFIQNLVFYIEFAYRIPDFGVWERGNKINNGAPELNTSSFGIAKSALRAINGLDLFGGKGSIGSTVHVIPDAIAHTRMALLSTLPRESASKEIDAALLSVIGFPAFAVDRATADKTRKEITDKLQGRYGCKRFLRDGHQCPNEEHGRLFYEATELAKFDRVECEWPLFFVYLQLDAIFRGDEEAATEYRDKLKTICAVTKPGQSFALLPEVYRLREDQLEAERAEPHSQDRECNDNVPLVWAQSLWIVAELLMDGLIDTHDVDPLGLHLASDAQGVCDERVAAAVNGFNVARDGGGPAGGAGGAVVGGAVDGLDGQVSRTQSGQQNNNNNNNINHCSPITSPVFGSPPVQHPVQVVLLSENEAVKSFFAEGGAETYTPTSCKDLLEIRPSTDLIAALSNFGASHRLGLTGRPGHDVGGLATSRLYSFGISSRPVLFLPASMDALNSFYAVHDCASYVLAVGDLLQYIARHWVEEAPPVVALMLTDGLASQGIHHLLRMCHLLEKGQYADVTTKLVSPSFVVSTIPVVPMGFLSKAYKFDHRCVGEGLSVEGVFETSNSRGGTSDLLSMLLSTPNVNERAEILVELIGKKGLAFDTGRKRSNGQPVRLRHVCMELTHRAVLEQAWPSVRSLAAARTPVLPPLAPAVQALLAARVTLVVGLAKGSYSVYAYPMAFGASAIAKLTEDIMASVGGSSMGSMLTQEVIVYASGVLQALPHVFQTISHIRITHILNFIARDLVRAKGVSTTITNPVERINYLGTLKPSALRLLFVDLMTSESERAYAPGHLQPCILRASLGMPPTEEDLLTLGLEDETPRPRSRHNSDNGTIAEGSSPETNEDCDRGWFRRRELDGVLHRVPQDFYKCVHLALRRSNTVKVGAGELHRDPLTSEMTSEELNFARLVDQLMFDTLVQPEYRQLLIEAFMVIGVACQRNPNLHFQGVLDMDALIHCAVTLYKLAGTSFPISLPENLPDALKAMPDEKARARGFRAFLHLHPNQTAAWFFNSICVVPGLSGWDADALIVTPHDGDSAAHSAIEGSTPRQSMF